MKILVTGGSTQVMIDKVRCISNIFKGRTAWDIAIECGRNGFVEQKETYVKLLTSSTAYPTLTGYYIDEVERFKTYDELYALMEKEVTTGNYDVIIASAAVSDYFVEGTYVGAKIPGIEAAEGLVKIDSSKKISSTENELYLKLAPTKKIVDQIRNPWGFKGKLVKFKLQVGITDEELIDIATKSMIHSKADIIVANCLEWAKERAFIITANSVKSVTRSKLPEELLLTLERAL